MPSSRPPRAIFLVAAIVIVTIILLLIDRAELVPDLAPAITRSFDGIILLSGAALLLGVVNVAWLHLRRIQTGHRDWVMSLALIAVLLAVFVAGLVNQDGAASPLVAWVFNNVVAPGQAALFALLIFFMAAAAYRFLRIGRPGGAWMMAGALLVMIVQLPISHAWLPPAIVAATMWLVDAPVMAALRGALIGSGIALLVIGVRLLLGKI